MVCVLISQIHTTSQISISFSCWLMHFVQSLNPCGSCGGCVKHAGLICWRNQHGADRNHTMKYYIYSFMYIFIQTRHRRRVVCPCPRQCGVRSHRCGYIPGRHTEWQTRGFALSCYKPPTCAASPNQPATSVHVRIRRSMQQQAHTAVC